LWDTSVYLIKLSYIAADTSNWSSPIEAGKAKTCQWIKAITIIIHLLTYSKAIDKVISWAGNAREVGICSCAS
jgi:hypothetical protein